MGVTYLKTKQLHQEIFQGDNILRTLAATETICRPKL